MSLLQFKYIKSNHLAGLPAIILLRVILWLQTRIKAELVHSFSQLDDRRPPAWLSKSSTKSFLIFHARCGRPHCKNQSKLRLFMALIDLTLQSSESKRLFPLPWQCIQIENVLGLDAAQICPLTCENSQTSACSNLTAQAGIHTSQAGSFACDLFALWRVISSKIWLLWHLWTHLKLYLICTTMTSDLRSSVIKLSEVSVICTVNAYHSFINMVSLVSIMKSN